MHRISYIYTLFVLLLACSVTSHVSAAIVMSDAGDSYDIITIEDTYLNISGLLMSQPWWGDRPLAQDLALDLGDRLGLPEGGVNGPGFARLEDSSPSIIAESYFSGGSVTSLAVNKLTVFTYAIVNPDPVPLPPAIALLALPLLGLFRTRRQPKH